MMYFSPYANLKNRTDKENICCFLWHASSANVHGRYRPYTNLSVFKEARWEFNVEDAVILTLSPYLERDLPHSFNATHQHDTSVVVSFGRDSFLISFVKFPVKTYAHGAMRATWSAKCEQMYST